LSRDPRYYFIPTSSSYFLTLVTVKGYGFLEESIDFYSLNGFNELNLIERPISLIFREQRLDSYFFSLI